MFSEIFPTPRGTSVSCPRTARLPNVMERGGMGARLETKQDEARDGVKWDEVDEARRSVRSELRRRRTQNDICGRNG